MPVVKSRAKLLVVALAIVVGVCALGGLLLWRAKRSGGGGAAGGPSTASSPRTGGGRGGAGGPGEAGGEPTLLLDDDPAGELRLEGIVLDGREQPVPGAVVTVSSNPPRQATSGDDGTFVFEKLVGRRYQLVARSERGVGGPVSALLTAKSDPVTLRLVPAAAVEVTVISSGDRKPIAGASVELRDLETIPGKTDAQGKALLEGVAPGGYELVAWAPGYAKSHQWSGVGRASEGARVVEKETVELRKGAPVSGRVVGPGGKPVAAARVIYQGVSEWMQQADLRRDAVTSDGDGRFRFEAVGAGTYRFAARHPDHAPGSSAQVTLDGQSEKAGIEIVLEAGAVLAGKVVDKGGAPVPSAAVRVAVKSAGWSFEDARQTMARPDGSFEMKGLAKKPLEVVAVGESAASETVAVDLTSTAEKRDVVLTLELDGKIAGTVVEPAGEPVEGAAVWAMPDLERGGAGRLERMEWRLRGAAEATTDAGGRFEIVGLRAGEYQLRASRPTSMRARFLRDGVTAKVGDREVRIVLEADGGVKGQVHFADGHVPDLFLVSFGARGFGGGGTPFSGSDGKFQLDGVPPGPRILAISGPSFDITQVKVTIEAGKTADAGSITVTKGRTLSGRVLADGKPVPGAEVFAARRLFGSGARPSAGGMGPRGGARTAITDEAGAFTLYGVGPRDLAVMAEHERYGRSTTVLVPGSPEPSTVELVLQPFAALEGKVTQGGRPAEGLGVNVTSQNVPNTNFVVQTGPDGSFRFDRLAPDTYLVQATSGRGPMSMSGMGFTTKVVKLLPGQTGRVTIDVAVGTSALTVKPQTSGGAVNGMVYLVLGRVQAKTAHALQYETAHEAPEFSKFTVMIASNPVTFDALRTGSYTACIIALPMEVRGMQASMEYLEREGDNLPVYCAEKAVSAPTQEILIPVQLPAYVPPPQGT